MGSYGWSRFTSRRYRDFADRAWRRSALILACVFSSTDSVAPLTLISKEAYPAVYSIVFGEGVFNDVVSILLASSVIGTQSEEPSIWSVLLNVVFYFVSALICGVVGGLLIAWSVRHVHLEPHMQVLWILVIAYSVAEANWKRSAAVLESR